MFLLLPVPFRRPERAFQQYTSHQILSPGYQALEHTFTAKAATIVTGQNRLLGKGVWKRFQVSHRSRRAGSEAPSQLGAGEGLEGAVGSGVPPWEIEVWESQDLALESPLWVTDWHLVVKGDRPGRVYWPPRSFVLGQSSPRNFWDGKLQLGTRDPGRQGQETLQ